MAFLSRAVSEKVEFFRRSRREGIVLLVSILCFKRFYMKNMLAVIYLGVKVRYYLFLCMNINEQVFKDLLPFRSYK